MEMIKTLFLASNPESTPPLMLDEEIRSITEKIRASDQRDALKLESLWAVRPDDLLQALNVHKPQIVHFSGHGSEEGEIILMDNERQAKPVSAAALKMLFTTLKDNIRLVILNACYSRLQATAIAEVIDCVIGIKTEIGDKAAITFAASFYRAIGFGRSIKEAFDQGKTALLLEGIPEEDTPQLLVRPDVDPSLIFLIKEEALKDSSRQPDQAAALCYRWREGVIEFLLIRSSGRRWIFPKGRIEPGEDLWLTAKREAFEEAGASGVIDKEQVTTFLHEKRELKSKGIELLIAAFLLKVEATQTSREKDREPTWFTWEQAEIALSEDRKFEYAEELRRVIRTACAKITAIQEGKASHGRRE
jgi:8-oxo-dGTP pyrophosphatase MutT (NUDIX family)